MSKLHFNQEDETETGKIILSLKREVRTRTLLISEAQANETRSVRRGANRIMCTWRQRRRSCRINYTWKESKPHKSSLEAPFYDTALIKSTVLLYVQCCLFVLLLRVLTRPHGQFT